MTLNQKIKLSNKKTEKTHGETRAKKIMEAKQDPERKDEKNKIGQKKMKKLRTLIVPIIMISKKILT